ncbi:MAG: c-type cytochrome [Cytophagaceae bacterium]|jgi:cytochrome c oxidase cbb3-type subunit 3|nr:c-type cytochrome [Cytophagaceae bacterium]
MKHFIHKKLRGLVMLLSLLFLGIPSVFAQEAPAAASAESSSSFFNADNWIIVVVLVVIIVVLLAILYMLYALSVFMRMVNKADGKEVENTPFIDFNAAVPIEREHEILTDHEYDGIRELDNKLPPWWVAMFYMTIVFAFVYMWYYHSEEGRLQDDEYLAEMVEAEVQMKLAADKVNENNVTLIASGPRLDKGKEIFAVNCASCHGPNLEGKIGPNLTDATWLHGGDIKDIFKTIKYGVPAKGMIPWQSQLSPAQIQEVSSYIKSMAKK